MHDFLLCVATTGWSWWFCWSLKDSGHYQNLHLVLKFNTIWETQAITWNCVSMQQHPGVCSSITPEFSFSWETRFTALIPGLLSNHGCKKMQEAEESAFLSLSESSSLCFKSSNKTALTKTLNSFMCLKIHVHTQRSSPLLPCLPKEQQRSKFIQTHGLHLVWAFWGPVQWGQHREAEERLPKVLFLAQFQHIYNLIGNAALPLVTV